MKKRERRMVWCRFEAGVCDQLAKVALPESGAEIGGGGCALFGRDCAGADFHLGAGRGELGADDHHAVSRRRPERITRSPSITGPSVDRLGRDRAVLA